MTALLEVRDVVKRYGGVRAVDGVSFDLQPASITGLIGPNGSGKTTLLSVIAGTVAPTSGAVALDGTTVSGRGAHRTVHAGIARTFQTSRLFPSWTLAACLRLARAERRGGRAGWDDGDVAGLLHLGAVLDRPCAGLTSAQQRLAMIAIALASAPRVLLLDEPAVGMDTDEARMLAGAVRRVRDEMGLGVVVVDHNMHFLMPLADTVLVMANGQTLASGTPAQIRRDEAVIAAYLGS